VLVLDASATVDFLIHRRRRGDWVAEQLSAVPLAHSPHLVDVEAVSALRRLTATGGLDELAGARAVRMLTELRLRRHSALELLPRIWSLRSNLSAYDAAYVALAEVLDIPLVTTDARLARSQGHRAQIVAFDG
jgi:predicted nucleic acid-binding protein